MLFLFPLRATGEVDSTQLSHAPTESEHLVVSPLKVRWVSLSFLLKRTHICGHVLWAGSRSICWMSSARCFRLTDSNSHAEEIRDCDAGLNPWFS